jgi:ABC-2 type transport system permease protein
MQLAPSTHFVSFSQDVLYRGAGLNIVWPDIIWLFGIGTFYFSLSLYRFRRAIAA